MSTSRRKSPPGQPLRVCYVIDRLAAAGTERQLVALIERLDRRLVSPYLVLLDGQDQVSQALAPGNCPVQRLGVHSLARLGTLRAAWRWARWLHSEAIDIVQVQFPDSTYFAVPAARWAGVPGVVRTRRDLGYWASARDRWLGRLLNRTMVHRTTMKVP